jgi:acyl-CoA reductase-like NAD-dependent aldehyde dehydrogenase/4-aminobutyrate aminotransferase-like enzyme
MTSLRSDYIGGAFLEPKGDLHRSVNPSKDGQTVVEVRVTKTRVDEAVHAAQAALPSWSKLTFDERWNHLVRFRTAIEAKKEYLADGIVQEIGKLRSEARVEVQTLINRFALVSDQIRNDLKDGALAGFPNEALRWHPHGVVAVIGPFNFPLHLCHAHVIPALLLGNTVVMKPSEVATLSGIRYAEVAHEAGLPPGVLNVIHGRGDTGAALVAHPHVAALAFTGSWPVGRRISEAVLDKPEMLIALEMGGKNTAIICEDADIRQAAHELIVGSYLTTGQRCTCTDRVLVHRSRSKELVDALIPLVKSLRFGDPDDASAFGGPLATMAGLQKLEHAMQAARNAGADVPVEGKRLPGGFFQTASFHVLPAGVHDVAGYTDTELFGPDLGIEIVDDDDDAIRVVNASPYGFANSVFTGNDARFDRYYRETRVGILNRNRSTNQASPRLPFGGAGRSGNFRPAGSFAPRNLAIPVAVQSNAAFALPTLSALAPHLPAPDLARLEAMHEGEEACEAARNLIDTPKPLGPQKPVTKGPIRLPESTAWLERFYAADRTVREKKPAIFDHLRSHGGYYVSVDERPLSVLDAMSQTATMPFGFNEDALVNAYIEGAFEDTMMRPHPIADGAGQALAEQYANVLRERVPGLPNVCFTACGAEANEKAYALCMNAMPKAHKLLAFEGSFHGRTLLSLYASHSPGKRVPFEIAGYEVTFAFYPTWSEPDARGPEDPAGFHEFLGKGDLASFERAFAEHSNTLLAIEARTLLSVAEKIRTGEYFAVVIEPMQSEGGDRYATPRFHRGLRLLTRALGVPLIMDEVQCGFGLGGSFAWHRSFNLKKADGTPDTPDCVLFAKRAQVGVVMTHFEDHEPTEAFSASLVRGRLHAELLKDADDACRIEGLVRAHLGDFEKRWGHFASKPRVRGFAFAFELPTPQHLNQYLAQRFYRGAIVFAAGDRTVRYRLQARFTEQDIAFLFRTIHQSLAWLEANGWLDGGGPNAPEWDEVPLPSKSTAQPPSREGVSREKLIVREAKADEVVTILPQVLALEASIYEPARRDPEARLRLGFTDPDGVVILAYGHDAQGNEVLVGSAIAIPLEHVGEMQGPDRDTHRGRHDSIYTVALTIDPRAQGWGIGELLKQAQLRAARAKKKADGSPRYLWNVGRNRVGLADAMSRINDRFGAYTVHRLEKQYGEEDGVARYYRQPVQALSNTLAGTANQPSSALHGSAQFPYANALPSLAKAEKAGQLTGPSLNKITLCNYLTPAIVRATEYVAQIAPELPHVFFTSGRDETIDKSLRMLRWHRKEGQTAIGLEGGYLGHTTAAARSLSCPTTHRQGAPHFNFPRVPHPSVVGDEATLEALRARIAEAGGASKVLGLYIEPVGERTGHAITPSFVAALAKFRAETKIPVVFVETASAYYRSGLELAGQRCAFASSAWTKAGSLPGGGHFVPDALVWWTGGQHGYVHVSAPLFVATPLTFVSTWDGDELSMIQSHHALRAARKEDVAGLAARLDAALALFTQKHGGALRGAGLHRVIDAGDKADHLVTVLRNAGISVRATPGGCITVRPTFDAVDAFVSALNRP